MNSRFFFFLLALTTVLRVGAQPIWGNQGSTPNGLWSLEADCVCPDCTEEEFIGLSQDYMQWGFSIAPNGNVYGLDGSNDIYQINTTTGAGTLILDLPYINDVFRLTGLASPANGIFYAANTASPVDTLIEINTGTGIVTTLGPLNNRISLGDMTFFNGQLYFISSNNFFDYGIVKITLSDPPVDEIIVDLPDDPLYALTGTTQCHTLLSFSQEYHQFVTINLLDGDMNYIGTNVNPFHGITSLREIIPPDCAVTVDLDCDDSSGADGPDYNALKYDCTTTTGVSICDYDILFQYDTLIEQVTIELVGTLPDGNNEYLELESSFPHITVDGSGTQTIILESDGEASATYFKAAMRAIRYHNTAFIPTPGYRNVNVNATTFSGTSTNQATAFLEVVEWPSYNLDLGPDIEVCDGEEFIINTQLQEVDHLWSTNSMAQFITVSESGTYSVTVTGDEFCPAIDSITVSFLPTILVEMGNDQVVCEGEEAIITIEIDSPFPLTIEIVTFPGGLITLTGVTGDIEIPIIVTVPISYTIQSVTASQPACIEVIDDEQYIDVIPSYNDTIPFGLCEGDSVLIGSDWISQTGYYTVHDNTQFGCDSIVTQHVSFIQSIMLFEESGTCNVADTGVFTQVITNPDGCDTIIETHVILGELDTTYVSGSTCRTGQEGVFPIVLTSAGGCDSVVINIINLMAPQDTSALSQTSCDSASLGVFENIFENHAGCDSLVITTVSIGLPDTTKLFVTTCDSSSLGVFETVYENQFECDSLVIITVTYSSSDSTFLSGQTCDELQSGVFVTAHINLFGCDSIVTQNVSWIPEIHVSIQAATCDENLAGVFIDTLTSIQGCDSIINETIELLPSHQIAINSTTCIASEAGVFTSTLINQFGCDSIVIETIDLLPADAIQINQTTCYQSEVGVFTNQLINQYGCDSVVTLTVTLTVTDTTYKHFYTCDANEVMYEELLFTGSDGCDSLEIITVDLHPLPQVDIVSLIDYNGYDVSCTGAEDGSITAQAQGTAPLSYIWNTNDSNETLSGLSGGNYSITVIDGNGCSVVNSILLDEPEEMTVSIIVTHPDCFLAGEGKVEIEVSGGVAPYTYSIDEVNYQAIAMFEGLHGGIYTISVKDANDCEKKDLVLINAIIPVDVNLGVDMTIQTGDSFTINAIVNVPYDSLASITWTGVDDPLCDGCLSQLVSPVITTTYSIEVLSKAGCSDKDELTLQVEENFHVFVPNVFSPNGDGINDIVFIQSGSVRVKVNKFAIYDRWGGVAFENTNFYTNAIQSGWDGTFAGDPLNAAVFAYRLVIEFETGKQEVRHGTITLVK